MTLEARIGRSYQLAFDQRLAWMGAVTTDAGKFLSRFDGIGFAFDGMIIT